MVLQRNGSQDVPGAGDAMLDGFGSRDRGRRRASRGHDALLPPATTSGFDLLVIKVAVLKGTSGASPSGDGLGRARRSGEEEVGRGSRGQRITCKRENGRRGSRLICRGD